MVLMKPTEICLMIKGGGGAHTREEPVAQSQHDNLFVDEPKIVFTRELSSLTVVRSFVTRSMVARNWVQLGGDPGVSRRFRC